MFLSRKIPREGRMASPVVLVSRDRRKGTQVSCKWLNLSVKCDDFNRKKRCTWSLEQCLSPSWFSQLPPKSLQRDISKCQIHISSGSYAPSHPNSEPGVRFCQGSVPTSTEDNWVFWSDCLIHSSAWMTHLKLWLKTLWKHLWLCSCLAQTPRWIQI